MARANTVQTNFTSGELSPQMYGRVDVTKYFNGARKLRNVIPLPQGGFRRRPGSKSITGISGEDRSIIRTFHFSETESYVLAFRDELINVYQNGSLLTAVTTPYGEDELRDLRFTQSADVLFIAHPSHYPRVVTRVNHTTWTIGLYDNEDGPYQTSQPEVTVTLSNPLDRATATAISSIFSTSGGTKNITAMTAVSATDFRILVTSAAHGFSTGNSILIKSVVGVSESLGAWVIDVSNANQFILRTSRISPTSVYASGGTAQVCSGATVEFREDNEYKLARVIDITSGTVATVDVIDAVVRPDETTKLTFDNVTTGNVVASVPTFAWTDIGKFVRPTHQSSGTVSSWNSIYVYGDSESVATYPETVLNFNDQSKQVVVTARTITATLTADAAYFAASDVGRFIRLKYGATWLRGTITAFTSSTVVTVELQDEPPLDSGAAYKLYNDGRTDTWKISAWSSTTGYPAVVAFHQDRLVWFSTTAEPSTKWLSKSGDYYNFEPSNPDDSVVSDDSAITMSLVSRQVNNGRWMDSGPVLLSGTEGAEWQIKPSSIQQALTPTNFIAMMQTAFGSANLDCIRVGTQTLFAERSANKIRELTYDFSIDAYATKDISILSEHLLREHGGVIDWAIQQNPYSIIWLVLGDGKVASVTYEKEHEVIAWALHDFSGTVESVCVTSRTSGEDVVNFIIQRVGPISTIRYLETVTDIMLDFAPYVDAYTIQSFGDVGIGYFTVGAQLAGYTVQVVLDGVYIGTQIPDASNRVHVGYVGDVAVAGLAITVICEILDPEGGSQAGTSQGKKKRINESLARVNNSWYFKIASSVTETNATENLSACTEPEDGDRTLITPNLTLAAPSSPAGTPGTVVPTSLYAPVSGDISFSVDDSFDNGGRFSIIQDEPYPLNIVMLTHKLNTYE